MSTSAFVAALGVLLHPLTAGAPLPVRAFCGLQRSAVSGHAQRPLISTPRAVKRLANSYGLFAAISRQRDPEASTSSLPAMVLLAALIGFPNLGSRLLTHLHDKLTAEPGLEWEAFVKGLQPIKDNGDSGAWSNAAALNLSPIEAENWRVLASALDRINRQAYHRECALPQAISEWQRWMVLIGRLSFPAGSVVARLQRTK